jgi:hypothetical protein
MKATEQEAWLVKKYAEVVNLEQHIKKLLAMVRGGQAIFFPDNIDRPDEAMLKDA